MKRFPVFMLIVAMAVCLPGCVSQSDYDEAVATSERSLADVQKAEDELASLSDELAASQTELSAALEEKEEMSKSLAEALALSEETSAQLEAAREEATAIQGELDAAKAELKTARADLETVTSELAKVQTDLEEKTAALASAEEEKANLSLSLDEVQAAYDEYRHEQEGGKLIVPDETLEKYALLLQEQDVQILSEAMQARKEAASEAIKGLLVEADTSRAQGVYDESYFLKNGELAQEVGLKQ